MLGLNVSLQNATFDTIIPGLLSGKFDLGRLVVHRHQGPGEAGRLRDLLHLGEGFYVGASSKTAFDGLDSLCGHTVAVESGTTEQTDAQPR